MAWLTDAYVAAYQLVAVEGIRETTPITTSDQLRQAIDGKKKIQFSHGGEVTANWLHSQFCVHVAQNRGNRAPPTSRANLLEWRPKL